MLYEIKGLNYLRVKEITHTPDFVLSALHF